MDRALHATQKMGQSIWYDNISRRLIASGELQTLIDAGITGVTSNPSIFEKAIASSDDYDAAIAQSAKTTEHSAEAIFESVAIEDIQRAADLLYPVYECTAARDGYVSFEVSPYFAHDTQRTIAEAKRLWHIIHRKNLMIKIPATPAGIAAIRRLTSEGLNINVTLLFAQTAYEAAALAYLEGLEIYAASGGDLHRVASVASFFVSRIDSVIDANLAKLADDAEKNADAKALAGQIAIANARLAYAWYQELLASPRWQALAAQGAQAQRLLWASTSTKNPNYQPTLYIDTLIAPGTVNTIPADTLAMFRKQERIASMVDADWSNKLETAETQLVQLVELGISLDEATKFLLHDGVQKFADAFDQLLGAVETKRRSLLTTPLAKQKFSANIDLSDIFERWRKAGNVRRLWEGDAKLWTGADEARWLGWLGALDGVRAQLDTWSQMRTQILRDGIQQVVVLGMGGSSLCPEVLQACFAAAPQHPALRILDTTVPEQIQATAAELDLSKTLFVVSSKSGSTAETDALRAYFFDQLEKRFDAARAARHFIAITDPGSSLEKLARAENWFSIVSGTPSIGGRFSALSAFGMLPGFLLGISMHDFLARANQMTLSCDACVPPKQNPGIALGLALAHLAKQGRNKITLFAPSELTALGAWIEQLLAESTGKNGFGLLPVDEEALGNTDVYGTDRVFVAWELRDKIDAAQTERLFALERAGHPVIRIEIENALDLGAEFFRWEIATAVVGAEHRINPFDQPDVEATKIATRTLLKTYRESGALPQSQAALHNNEFEVFAAADFLQRLCDGRATNFDALLSAFLQTLSAGDYFAVQAYLPRDPQIHKALQTLRHRVRDAKRVATTLGYGPRFLHSTGQLHKGDANQGVFLQLTAKSELRLDIPGQDIDFGTLLCAQAQGDFQVLAERGRRILRIEFSSRESSTLAAQIRALDAQIARTLCSS